MGLDLIETGKVLYPLLTGPVSALVLMIWIRSADRKERRTERMEGREDREKDRIAHKEALQCVTEAFKSGVHEMVETHKETERLCEQRTALLYQQLIRINA